MNDDQAMLPEHAANPFTAGLGPPHTFDRHLEMLTHRITVNPIERRLPPHLRRYCVLRLFDYRDPLRCQVDLFERLGMVIRQGYKGRDPALGLHMAAVQDAVERIEAKDVQRPSTREVRSTATGFALLGNPGMGKSTTVDRILERLPRILRPYLPYSVDQVPWLKVECPATGSRKQFCYAFLVALDARLGTTYAKMFGNKRETADEMMLHVQHLAQLHAIGVLVIDEIQHLNQSSEGTKPLMNFLVTLVNLIGVPVVLIGTMAAAPILQEDFREARRASGLGSPIWNRLPPGVEWDDFVEHMWTHQWTSEDTPLTPEIRDVLYLESQGIIDVVIRLFVLAQFRAISRGEALRVPEVLSAALIRSVAADEFRIISPMMHALRDGRSEALAAYPDLTQLHQHVDSVLARATGASMKEFRERGDARRAAELPRAAPAAGDMAAVIRAQLVSRGFGADVVSRVMDEVGRRHPDGDDLFAMMRTVEELIEGAPRKARKKLQALAASPQAVVGDLRDALRAPMPAGATVHSVFLAAGIVAPMSRVLAA